MESSSTNIFLPACVSYPWHDAKLFVECSTVCHFLPYFFPKENELKFSKSWHSHFLLGKVRYKKWKTVEKWKTFATPVDSLNLFRFGLQRSSALNISVTSCFSEKKRKSLSLRRHARHADQKQDHCLPWPASLLCVRGKMR